MKKVLLIIVLGLAVWANPSGALGGLLGFLAFPFMLTGFVALVFFFRKNPW